MRHLKSVTGQGERSHWVAEAPVIGTAEWDAEVINERPNELIAWRSVSDADVDTAGSVHFTPAPGGGTQVRINMKYLPPAGKVGHWVAKLFGDDAEQQIDEDLCRFKQKMEAGAFPAM